MATFGEQLRVAREDVNIPAARIAQIIGVHRTTFYRWERDVAQPSKLQRRELARLLRTPELDKEDQHG